MVCTSCGSQMKKKTTTLPFKISDTSIVIIKNLPVIECENCQEYLIEDEVMAKVEELLESVDKTTELEVVSYAA